MPWPSGYQGASVARCAVFSKKKGGHDDRGTHVDVGSYGAVEVAKADGHGERDATLVGALHVACYPCSGSRSVRTSSCMLRLH